MFLSKTKLMEQTENGLPNGIITSTEAKALSDEWTNLRKEANDKAQGVQETTGLLGTLWTIYKHL